jgi:hypothetical protein
VESSTHPEQQQSPPIVPASAIPGRESSLRHKHASPHIEQDYDEYRNILARSAVGSQKTAASEGLCLRVSLPFILLAIESVELLVFGCASFVDAGSVDALGMPRASTVVYY